MPLHVGEIVDNRYRIEILLGQGGMGAVYGAIDLVSNAPLALKENRRHSPGSLRQFDREAGLLRQLDHPNLPRVANCFQVPGQGQYLVMDYIAGDDLNEILVRRGSLPEVQALGWFQQVLAALAFLHSRNIIHRDVKPANVKVTPEERVYLVDFGLAKVYDPVQETTIGARGVTPGYAPPEQYGPGRTDARTDIYSSGATLYAMVTGQRPPDAVELMMGRSELVPPRQIQGRLSARVEGAILRAMQPRPQDRPQSIVDFGRELGLRIEAQPAPVKEEEETRLVDRRPEAGTAPATTPPPAPAPTVPKTAPEVTAAPPSEPEPAPVEPTRVADEPPVKAPPVSVESVQEKETAGPATVETRSGPPGDRAGAPPADRHPLEPEMVEVPAILYLMGTSDGHLEALPRLFDWAADYGAGLIGTPFGQERPHHAVALSAYEMGRYPVTNAQYAPFVEATGRKPPEHWGGPHCPSELTGHPVVYVNWRDALEYAAWLARETGRPYRLPTEAEWERAARGDDMRLWPWGDSWDPGRVNWQAGGSGGTVPVGQFSPEGDSPLGCAGMAGNVYEWCSSLYRKYPYRADDGREKTRGRKYRVIRGGAWNSENPGYLRCAARVSADPRHDFEAVGFRLARTVAD
jgi:formylglycine-generating enzyme required for sulfatase activity/serine/threonine protein kinase